MGGEDGATPRTGTGVDPTAQAIAATAVGAQNKEPGATCAEVGEGVACYIQGGKKSSRVIWRGCTESGDREKDDWRVGETEV